MGTQGWIWHSSLCNVLVASNSTADSVWIYTTGMGWMWTSSEQYPSLYRPADDAWLWYNGSTDPCWFLNHRTGLWETMATSVSKPGFNPNGGTFTTTSLAVVVACSTTGATIRYTTNGVDPTESSSTVISGGIVTLPLPGTLKAKAWKDGLSPSAVKSAYFDCTTTNGIPLNWLSQYGLPTDGSMDQVKMPGSHFTVWEEWRSGTNPNDPDDNLRMNELPTIGQQGVLVRWRSATGRTYRIERSGSLAATPPFNSITTGVPGIAGTSEFIDATAGENTKFFYRVVVE